MTTRITYTPPSDEEIIVGDLAPGSFFTLNPPDSKSTVDIFMKVDHETVWMVMTNRHESARLAKLVESNWSCYPVRIKSVELESTRWP
jgi:hypothetical protein